MIRPTTLGLLILAKLVVLLSGCDLVPEGTLDASTNPPPGTSTTPPQNPSQNDLDAARVKVEAAMEAAHQARTALELLGVLPTYTCGEAQGTFVGRAMSGLETQLACGTVTTTSQTDGDLVLLTTPAGGCAMGNHVVEGTLQFRFALGTDTMQVELDTRRALVDGQPLPVLAGYGTCGDEDRVWVTADGMLPNRSSVSYHLDGVLKQRPGLPLVGGTTLILDGTASLTTTAGVDRVTFYELEYEVGDYLPKNGAVLVETSSGHNVRAQFLPVFWSLGLARVTVDASAPVDVPVLH